MNHLLNVAGKVIDLNQVSEMDLSLEDVNRYYFHNTKLYRKFHSKQGAMHFPIYKDVAYGPKGAHFKALDSQVEGVSKLMEEYNARSILELGPGQGYNLQRLSLRFPNTQLFGLENSITNLKIAKKQCENQKNIKFISGDFQNSKFYPQTMDMIFAIESFCYNNKVLESMATISEKLNPGGLLVIYDMFSNSEDKTEPEELSENLIAKGFGVNNWKKSKDLLKFGEQVGLKILENEDLSPYILPNVQSFQKNAEKWLRRPYLLKLAQASGVIHKSTIHHLITGLLTPSAMRSNLISYRKLVFVKT